MPVNMDPESKRRRLPKTDSLSPESSQSPSQPTRQAEQFGEITDADTTKALAEAEWKNLWDATEVIDMDTF